MTAALQRILLPANLPDIAGWAVATLYEPAGDTVLVGGDFYDWFTLPNGGVLFFLGDVSGKGPLAGALGMSIRKALKGIAWATGDVFQAMPILEKALAEEFKEAFATLCLLELTPTSGLLRLLLAGHPAPWLRHDGIFRELDAPANTLLGPCLLDSWQSISVELRAGDMVVLFTDGLTEAKLADGTLFGEGSLQHFLQSLPVGLASYETVLQADAHLRRATGRLTDDVIIGVLTFQPAPPSAPVSAAGTEVLSLALGVHSSSAGLARRFVRDACRDWALGGDLQFVAEAVASELVTNSVLHARTDLELHLTRSPGTLSIGVRDFSAALPPLTEPSAARQGPELEHGRGLELVRRLGAELTLDLLPVGKTVWARLAL